MAGLGCSVSLDSREDLVGEQQRGKEADGAHGEVNAPQDKGHVGQVEQHGHKPGQRMQCVDQEADGIDADV